MYHKDRILIVDDEKGLLDMISLVLKKEHFSFVDKAMSGREALEFIGREQYDLIILDVMLPDYSGFDLCLEIKKLTNAPILFLSALGSDFDKITGLTIGGEDYMTKPFNPLELVARIRVILRRKEVAMSTNKKDVENRVYDYGVFKFHSGEGTIEVNGEITNCTAKEFELLKFFCMHPNQVFSAQQIYEAVWNEIAIEYEKTVAMYISKIRKKIKDDAKSSCVIVNMRGIGYKFVPPKRW